MKAEHGVKEYTFVFCNELPKKGKKGKIQIRGHFLDVIKKGSKMYVIREDFDNAENIY